MVTDTQSDRAGVDTTTAERATRRMPPRRARSAPRHAARSHRQRGAYPRGVLRFATGIVLIVALAAAGFGAAAYTRAARSEARVSSLQAQLAALRQRLAGDEQAAASERRHAGSVIARANAVQQSIKRFNWQLQSVPSEAQLAGLRNEVAAYTAAYAACLPQLQKEINGLRLNWRIDATKPATDSFKLFTSAPASASCSAALAGR